MVLMMLSIGRKDVLRMMSLKRKISLTLMCLAIVKLLIHTTWDVSIEMEW